jgi:hypothetical protein
LRDGRSIDAPTRSQLHLSSPRSILHIRPSHLLRPRREVLKGEEGLLGVDGGLDLVGDPHGGRKGFFFLSFFLLGALSFFFSKKRAK